jgi:alkanesulfonate monooxygenase SsuD/methylene tetrahydromethanopterin reductase-like flavin-dependent oxidoreductase (luciferase family)
MRAIWTQDEATYHGRWVHFDRIWSWPKPLQQPYPPILLGTIEPSPLVVRLGSGWLPLSLAHPGQLLERIAVLHDRARQRDVDPASLDVTVFCLEPTSAEDVALYHDAGATRVVVKAPTTSEDDVLAFLDGYRSVLGAPVG